MSPKIQKNLWTRWNSWNKHTKYSISWTGKTQYIDALIESKQRRKPYYPEVDEYDDPLEFYEFHPDDFLDYEDAEEYYYENGGE